MLNIIVTMVILLIVKYPVTNSIPLFPVYHLYFNYFPLWLQKGGLVTINFHPTQQNL